MIEVKKRTTPHYPKSFVNAVVLCWILGIFGFHRFYTSYKRIGIIQLCTLGGFFVWWMIDLISICFNVYKDKYGNELDDYNGTLASLVLTGTAVIILAIVIMLLPYWVEKLP